MCIVQLSKCSLTETQYSYIGEHITLKCHTTLTSRVKWIFMESNYSTQYPVYSDGRITDMFSVNVEINIITSAGQYDLLLYNVQHVNSGWYVCIEDDGIGQTHAIQLIALGNLPYPACNSLLTFFVTSNNNLLRDLSQEVAQLLTLARPGGPKIAPLRLFPITFLPDEGN